jgi:hypothetical protein
MAGDDQPKSGEKVIRGLLRLSSELGAEFGRQHQDKDDFLRRSNYLKTGLPENGISVFRRSKYPTNAEFYARLGSKKAVAATECALEKLTAKGLKAIVSGVLDEHISLRCPDCDMSSLPAICKPTSGASFADCPFFDKTDPLGLNSDFQEVEAPAVRAPTRKG